MNKHGHTETLVPAHPGNTHALKSGVYSERALASRVDDLEAILAERPRLNVVADVLLREVAALVVLSQAMDESLQAGGIEGRRGEPRTLLGQRLRLNERLRKTVELLAAEEHARREALVSWLASGGDMAIAAASFSDSMEPELLPKTVIDLIACLHRRETIEDVLPSDFVPELFLRAVVRADDPAVGLEDRTRAQRLLDKRKSNSSVLCVCSGSARARDEIEFEAWVTEARESIEPARADQFLVEAVRQLLSGEQFDDCHRARKALKDVVSTGRAVSASDDTPPLRDEDEEDNAALERFWQTLLAADIGRPTRERLKAFVTLEESGAFPGCTCSKYELDARQLSPDAARAYYIRLMAGRDWRSAEAIAQFPQLHRAVQEAIAAEVAQRPPSLPGAEFSQT